ncbi:MAG TPA: hypothetical protein ENI89_09660 [Desulfobulbus sp.]|nr:hypothetical protein [Desulfobulbus sp.]
MKTATRKATGTQADVGHEVSRFTLGVGIALAILVGIWGLACMIGGLANCGVGELAGGLLGAITGG